MLWHLIMLLKESHLDMVLLHEEKWTDSRKEQRAQTSQIPQKHIPPVSKAGTKLWLNRRICKLKGY